MIESGPTIGITGGLGLIGKALRAKLSTAVVLLVRNASNETFHSNEKYLVGNFSDSETIKKFIPNIDVLIHAASSVGPRSDYSFSIIEDDLIGTLNLARRFFQENPTGHFVFLSTAGGLYDLEDTNEKTEDSEIVATSLYGSIKLLVEDALEEICKPAGRVTILRPSAVYGDPFKKNLTVGLIDKLIKSTFDESKNNLVSIFDKMESARDYLHVDDLVLAIKGVIDRENGENFEIYNVGTGKETSIEEVIRVINSLREGKVRVEFLPTPNKRSSLVVKSDKIFRDVGWKAQISFRNGVGGLCRDAGG